MGSATVKALGAEGRKDLLIFDASRLRIARDKSHALYDESVERELRPEFVEDIREHGILEPVIIWRDGEDVWVVAGRDRTRAAELLGIKVPCILRQGTILEMALLMRSENAHRRDPDVVAEARQARHILDVAGASEEQVARASGWSVPTLKNRLALLDLSAKAQSAVRAGKLPATTAIRELPKLGRKEQDERVDELVAAAPRERKKRDPNADTNGKPARPRMRNAIVIHTAIARLENEGKKRDKDPTCLALAWALGADNDFGAKYGATKTYGEKGGAS